MNEQQATRAIWDAPRVLIQTAVGGVIEVSKSEAVRLVGHLADWQIAQAINILEDGVVAISEATHKA